MILRPSGLEHAAGDSPPGDVIELVVDAFDDVDVAVPCAEGGGVAIGEEVEAAEAEARPVGGDGG